MKAVFWIRWALLAPCFFLSERGAVFLLGFGTALLHVDARQHLAEFWFFTAILEALVPALVAVAVAPAGKLLVGAVGSFIGAIPGIFAWMMGPYAVHQMSQTGGASVASSPVFRLIRLCAIGYLSGAMLAFATVAGVIWLKSVRRKPSETDSFGG